MPLKQGNSQAVISENIAELHQGKTFQRTAQVRQDEGEQAGRGNRTRTGAAAQDMTGERVVSQSSDS